jgi:hypothetical protein
MIFALRSAFYRRPTTGQENDGRRTAAGAVADIFEGYLIDRTGVLKVMVARETSFSFQTLDAGA